VSKHTSGPWTIECGKNYSNEIVGKSKTGKDWVIARTTAAKVGRDTDDANARLIAAAPELLKALECIASATCEKWEMPYADFKEQFMPWARNIALATLAKAKGNQP